MPCPYCRSDARRRSFPGLRHPRMASHGPFDLHECRDCGSMTTAPMPTPAQLSTLYGSFDSGMPAELREMRERSPMSAWYEQAAERAAERAGLRADQTFTWIEVGAGGGELAAVLAERFPQSSGVAADWHVRPSGLSAANVRWVQSDLNRDFAGVVGAPADLVVSLAVLEHVLDPESFVRNCVQLVRPGGALYLVVPDYGSPARRVLGRRWPYFTPGEHLTMPTTNGAAAMITRVLDTRRASVFSARTGIPYPLGYVFEFVGLKAVANMVRRVPPFSLPTGVLEAGFVG